MIIILWLLITTCHVNLTCVTSEWVHEKWVKISLFFVEFQRIKILCEVNGVIELTTLPIGGKTVRFFLMGSSSKVIKTRRAWSLTKLAPERSVQPIRHVYRSLRLVTSTISHTRCSQNRIDFAVYRKKRNPRYLFTSESAFLDGELLSSWCNKKKEHPRPRCLASCFVQSVITRLPRMRRWRYEEETEKKLRQTDKLQRKKMRERDELEVRWADRKKAGVSGQARPPRRRCTRHRRQRSPAHVGFCWVQAARPSSKFGREARRETD